jgi:hypothetical protein
MGLLTYNASSFNRVQRFFQANYEGINRSNQVYIIPQLDHNPALRTDYWEKLNFKSVYVFYFGESLWWSSIVDHLPNPSSDEDRIMQLTRKSKGSLCFYRKDLNDAIAALLNKQLMRFRKKGRASRCAAYIGKSYLYQKKWQQVVDVLI